MSEETRDEKAWERSEDTRRDEEEQRVIYAVLDSFRQYRRSTHLQVTHGRRQNFYALPEAHQEYLRIPPICLLDTLSKVDDAIDTNADLAERIEKIGAASLGLEIPEDDEPPWAGCADQNNIDKCRSTLNQLYRDWSAEGAIEREISCKQILHDLNEHVPIGEQMPKILIPGAGLGRLVYDLAKAGYNIEGNEISYHQLFTSSFILNQTEQTSTIPLHPFASTFSNNLSRQNQLRKVDIPDVWPGIAHDPGRGGTPLKGTMGISAGDFCTVYSSPKYAEVFDAVVTVFFVDTAPNLLRYVEAVHNCLKPGGRWINVGPLQWHVGGSKYDGADDVEAERAAPATEDRRKRRKLYSMEDDKGIGEPGSFELSEDEIAQLVQDHAFVLHKHELDSSTTSYIGDRMSMSQHMYRPVHWIAKKVAMR